MRKISIFLILFFFSVSLFSNGNSEAVAQYIDQYKWIAVQQMKEYHIPASITLAQGILESGAGMSELAQESNNHFGIKCHSDWKGDKVYYDDDANDECFRKYKHVEDSYLDHSIFLASGKRYASLFELEIDDYKSWAKGLKAAGYATNPKYADLLIDLIEKYKLYELDKMELADIKKEKKNKKKTNPEKIETSEEKNEDTYFSWRGYKENVFYFNRIPTITIKEKDTPESIANEHGKKVEALYDYNDLKPGEILTVGKSFYLQPKRKKGTKKYHPVKSNETMWTISRDEGVLLNQLYEKNLLDVGEEPAEGEQIYLRKKRKTPPRLSKVQSQSNEPESKIESKNEQFFMDRESEDESKKVLNVKQDTDTTKKEISNEASEGKTKNLTQLKIYHTVEPQETLYAIAKKYQTTVEQIQDWNNMTSNTIYVGQKIFVGYKSN